MNLILMMYGYLPAIIRKRDRLAYIEALEYAQLGGLKDDYLQIIVKAVNRSLDVYLKAIKGGENELLPEKSGKLLKIGDLAKAVQETSPTIRHWTQEKLLDVAERSASGYQLYSPDTIERIKKIKKLKHRSAIP